MSAQSDQPPLAQEFVEEARAEGVDLVGPGGLLSGLTKPALDTALEAEMSEHLGYDTHDPAGRNRVNSHNGTRFKTVLTEIGPVEIDVPRDREGTFEPAIVRKRQRLLDGIDQNALSLTAGGLTSGEIAAHFDEVYGAKVGKDTISRITDKVVEDMAEWRTGSFEVHGTGIAGGTAALRRVASAQQSAAAADAQLRVVQHLLQQCPVPEPVAAARRPKPIVHAAR